MLRGTRRGCVRLKGAVVGIDDDDDSTFTITVDAKTFHFQAHDTEERENWIRALEDTILRHASTQRQRWNPNEPLPTMADFDRKLTESDAYLQLLIEQANHLERQSQTTEDANNKARCQIILENLNQVLESIKHCIVLLQIAKNTAFPMNGVYHPCNAIPDTQGNQMNSDIVDRSKLSDGSTEDLLCVPSLPSEVQTGIEVGRDCAESLHAITGAEPPRPLRQERPVGTCLRLPSVSVPEVSYSSSEDEDFFDADDFTGASLPPQSAHGPKLFEDAVEILPGDSTKVTSEGGRGSDPSSSATGESSRRTLPNTAYRTEHLPNAHLSSMQRVDKCYTSATTSANSAPATLSDLQLDYDSMYDEEDEELGSLEGHGSVIQHLISQVKIGMDLTKVVLPTFILERRSLLEMYADFFAHPDLFCSISDYSDPKDRMVQVLRWYLSAFHAGRKSEVARKPYNPILGEVFRCYWDMPSKNTYKSTGNATSSDGPVPWAMSNQLAFVAEQVSHHPPISAFYAEHKDKRISFCGHIWTKSKFLGLSVCVNNIGQGCVSLLDLDEEYILNFPSGYGRSILTVPWVELGGTCQITCSKTGYSANVEFLMKPFYGGKKHKICAEAISPGEKKPFLIVEGEWNGTMTAKWADGRNELFIDTQNLLIVKKKVKPVFEQQINESRFLWREVTAGLKCWIDDPEPYLCWYSKQGVAGHFGGCSPFLTSHLCDMRFNNINQATAAKFALEQKQRDEAKERKESNLLWQTKLFSLHGDNWVYTHPLQQRSK